MPEQLPLDFSSAHRHRRARRHIERMHEVAAAESGPQLLLLPHIPNLDVYLHDTSEAGAEIAGEDPERTVLWLQKIVGPVRTTTRRRCYFPVRTLDRLLCVLEPAKVTLDAAAKAVGRALWAAKVGWKPLKVQRHGNRLVATSYRRWPSYMRVVDAPWSAIQCLLKLDVDLDIRDDAKRLLLKRLSDAGQSVARAGLAGSTVRLESAQPKLLKKLDLPAVAYDGRPGTGRFKMPLLAADCLLNEPAVETSDELEEAIRHASRRITPVSDVPGLPFDLYPFQKRDVAKARRIMHTTGGVLFAAEMGSGKTVMTLSAVALDELWPILVVAPLAAFSSWKREAEAMGRSVYLATDPVKKSWDKMQQLDVDVVVMSYDRLHAFTELAERLPFQAIVCDEIQRIRSAGSRRSRAVRKLSGAFRYRIGLSGTPMQNRITDLLPVGAFLLPGEWKPRATTSDLTDVYLSDDPVHAVADHVGTLMVRRRKEDTGAKIVGRTTRRVMVELTREQKNAIREMEQEARRAKEEGALPSHLHIFARLQRMRQILSSPKSADVGGRNPKLEAAVEVTEDFIATKGKAVVFTASRGTYAELAEEFDRLGIGWVGINGSTRPQDRLEQERRFHEDDSVQVFIGTIQSCAEALTLSPTGKGLINIDYVWNPQEMEQAYARIHRMNSTTDVEFILLHAQWEGSSTLDDRMHEVLTAKKALFAKVIDRDDDWVDESLEVDMDDLMFLLTGDGTDFDADTSSAVSGESAGGEGVPQAA